MGNKNMDEPCKGDTPAQPRAQALGKSLNHIYEPQRGGTIKTRPPDGLQKDKFYLFFCGALQNAVIARH